LQYFLALSSIFVNFSEVVVSILRNSNNFILFYSTDSVGVSQPELAKTPLRVKIARQDSLHKAKHALRVLNIIGFSGMILDNGGLLLFD
jgi:hypothetical protein